MSSVFDGCVSVAEAVVEAVLDVVEEVSSVWSLLMAGAFGGTGAVGGGTGGVVAAVVEVGTVGLAEASSSSVEKAWRQAGHCFDPPCEAARCQLDKHPTWQLAPQQSKHTAGVTPKHIIHVASICCCLRY